MTRQIVCSNVFCILFCIFIVSLFLNYKPFVNAVIAKEKTKTCKDINCTGVFFSTTATREFHANHPSFRTLKVGDKIDVVAIKFSHRGDIMEGLINGERGYFYTNFIDKDPYRNFLLEITSTTENKLSVVSFSEDKIGKGLLIKNVVAKDYLDSDLHIAFNPDGVYVPKKSNEDDSGHGHSHGGHGHSHGGHGHSHGGHEETAHNHRHVNEEIVATSTKPPSVEKTVKSDGTTLPTGKVTVGNINDKTHDNSSGNLNNIKLEINAKAPPPIPEKTIPQLHTPEKTASSSIASEVTTPAPNIAVEITSPAPTIAAEVTTTAAPIAVEITTTAAPIAVEITTPAPIVAEVTTPAPIVAEVTTTAAPIVAEVTTTAAPIAAKITTPAPIVAEVTTTAAPIAAEITTTVAPIAVEITTPAPTIVVEITTPAPTIAAEVTTTAAPIAVEITTPVSAIAAEVTTTVAPIAVEVTTPAPSAGEITTPTPIAAEVTTQSPESSEEVYPIPNINQVTTPAPAAIDTATNIPVVEEQTTTLSPIESINLPTIKPIRKIPTLNTMDLLSKRAEEMIKTTTSSPMAVDPVGNETFETKETILEKNILYGDEKSEEMKDEKSFLQVYIGYYLKLAIVSFRETLPQPLSGIDDSGIVLLILAPISILIHLTNKFILSDDGPQEVFERKYLHDSLTKIKEQEVMINKLKETQADPQMMAQYQNIKEEYERIYKENQEVLKTKESLMYENGNYKKMLERKENENHNLREEIKSVKDEVFSKGESLTSLEIKAIKLQSENNSLLEENKALNDSVNEKNKIIDKYSKECEKSVEENKLLKRQIIDIEEQLKNGKVEHDKLRKEIEGLSELLEEMNQNSQNQDNEGAGSIGSTGWSDVGDVEIESAGSNSLGCNKNGKRRSPDLGGGNILDLARSRTEIKRLEQEIEDITSKLSKERVAKESLLSKISLLEREIDIQKNELTHNTTERNENSAQISRLLTLVEERSNEIKDLQNREKELRIEYMELDQKYRDLRDDKIGIEYKCKESESLVKSLQSEVSKLETINYNEVRKLKNQLKLLEEEKNSEIKGLKFQNETLQSRMHLSSPEFSAGGGSKRSMGLSEGLPLTASNPLMNSSGPVRPLWSGVDDIPPVVSSSMRNQVSLFGSELDSSDNGSLKKSVKIRKSMRKRDLL